MTRDFRNTTYRYQGVYAKADSACFCDGLQKCPVSGIKGSRLSHMGVATPELLLLQPNLAFDLVY